MTKSRAPKRDPLAQYKTCESCGADFEHLYIGGVGRWQNAIMCLKCDHIRDGVPVDRVIVPLIAEQYDLDHETAKEVNQKAQEDYEAKIARNSARRDG